MQAETKMHFNGEYCHSIDANNRVIMPAKIKDALYGESFTIYYKPGEECLRLYITSEWNEMISKIAYVDDGVDRTDLQRHFSMNSKRYDLDFERTQGTLRGIPRCKDPRRSAHCRRNPFRPLYFRPFSSRQSH